MFRMLSLRFIYCIFWGPPSKGLKTIFYLAKYLISFYFYFFIIGCSFNEILLPLKKMKDEIEEGKKEHFCECRT